MTEQVIGIDLGGTAIKLGRFDRDGNCYESLTIPTPQPPRPKAVLLTILDAIDSLTKKLNDDIKIRAIGIGTPGPVDGTGRIAKVAINLDGWHNIPLADWIESATKLPVILANDANCAGLGEAWLGAGNRFSDLIMLTLGTGVGGAVIIDGKLFVGQRGAAGELGLISLNPDGPDCNSGNQGSLEQYVSVQGIRRDTGMEPLELANLAEKGDQFALEYWEKYGRYLGVGLANLIYILTPQAVIIGGGVSAGYKFFLPMVKHEIEQRVIPSSRENLALLIAELGNQAGMVGAAKLAWQIEV